MRFTEQQIETARRFTDLGLKWEPAPGHYVFDETNFCNRQSPFHDQVFFILNYDYFIRRVGGVDEFKRIMTWLPTWPQCREILEQLGITNKEVFELLATSNAIQDGTELSVLYKMIEERLQEIRITQPLPSNA